MQNPLRAALARGDTVTGRILFSGSPMVVELDAAAGIDFVIIDMEHSVLDLDRCAHLVRGQRTFSEARRASRTIAGRALSGTFPAPVGPR